ncbi:hypothetical protein BO78DRAFT_325171, partial [Aspergillus sclerotiicarbonarius CBS 121057]
TNNNAVDSMIATHFGKDTKAIIQIRDEDFKETSSFIIGLSLRSFRTKNVRWGT